MLYLVGHAVAQLVEALRYKPGGRGFDSHWCFLPLSESVGCFYIDYFVFIDSFPIFLMLYLVGHAVAQLVEALCYKPEGRGFDSRWCYWIFSLTQSFRHGPEVYSASNRNEYQEYFLGIKAAGA